MSTKKLVLTSFFVALAIVIPQAFHLIGGPGVGAMLLPMHIPVFVGAMLLGPISGLIIAVIAIVVGVFLGMPPIPIATYMIFELSTYALLSGYLYKTKGYNVVISFLISKAVGMFVALGVVYLMLNLFQLNSPMLTASASMFIVGVPGIIIQIIIVPGIIHLLKKSDLVYEIS